MRRLTLAAPLAGLLLVGCAGSSPDDEAAATPAPATATPSTAPTPAPTAAASAEPSPVTTPDDAQAVNLTVAGGQVTGDTGRVEVPLGTRVRLTVTADVVDEIHVHGFDLHQDTTVGQAAQLEFLADRAGVYEIELEESKTLLTRLQVQ